MFFTATKTRMKILVLGNAWAVTAARSVSCASTAPDALQILPYLILTTTCKVRMVIILTLKLRKLRQGR